MPHLINTRISNWEATVLTVFVAVACMLNFAIGFLVSGNC